MRVCMYVPGVYVYMYVKPIYQGVRGHLHLLQVNDMSKSNCICL